MIKLLYVMAGGAVGALMRYLLAGYSHKLFSGIFPVGTLAVNLVGSFIIGLLWGMLDTWNMPSHLRIFLFIGILGSFTTFSSFSLETMHLLREGNIKLALINIIVSVIMGLVLVVMGFLVSRGIVNQIK